MGMEQFSPINNGNAFYTKKVQTLSPNAFISERTQPHSFYSQIPALFDAHSIKTLVINTVGPATSKLPSSNKDC